MSELRLPGLQTGIDTDSLIQQLMELQRRTLYTYENRVAVWEQKSSALSQLEGLMSKLRTATRALSDEGDLRAFNVSTSDDEKVTAEATSSAYEGSHNVVVNQLATSERWVHATGTEYMEDYVGAGTFIYSYNDEETSVTTTATTTLDNLVGLINNDANNPGVTANLLYYNDAYHLVLNGNDAGSDYSISVNASSTETWKSDSAFTDGSDNAPLSTLITDLDGFSGTLGGSDVIEITGTDHSGSAITQVDISITSNTKMSHLVDEINDAFNGIAKATLVNGEIVLTDKDAGASSLSVTLTYNDNGSGADLTGLGMSVSAEGGATTADLSGFAASDFTETQSAQNSLLRVDGYPAGSSASELQTISRATPPNNGTYTLTYEGQTTDAIAYNADTDTIKAALEVLSTVNTGDITVGGGANGLNDGDVTFTFSNTLGDVSMITADGANLGPGADPVTTAETTKGVPAYISRSSNTVDDVIGGVTLHLHDTTDASGEDITLTRDVQSVKDKLETMVANYNAAVEYIKETTGYDSAEEVAGLLMGDFVVSTIQYQIRNPLIQQTAGFTEDIDTFLTPVTIGLEIDRDGVLSLDSNVFDEAIAEDFLGVLALIGSDKAGSSDSNDIEFYGANKYTTGGEYDVEVDFDGSGDTSEVRIKLSTESTFRTMVYSNGIASGISTLDDDTGYPDYAECGLQLTVPTTGTASSTSTATVRVKQGFTGKIEDAIDNMLKSTSGTLVIGQEYMGDQIEVLQDKIELEESRLEKREDRLILRFARLERTLAMLQSQMAAAGIMSSLA